MARPADAREVGGDLGVTAQWIARIERTALEKLRDAFGVSPVA
jgi:DNA-directed RNA polymerase sigma subunit (sigma70/sigma32)